MNRERLLRAFPCIADDRMPTTVGSSAVMRMQGSHIPLFSQKETLSGDFVPYPAETGAGKTRLEASIWSGFTGQTAG